MTETWEKRVDERGGEDKVLPKESGEEKFAEGD